MSIFLAVFVFAFISLLMALISVVALSRLYNPQRQKKRTQLDGALAEEVIFLFDGRKLMDATDRARALLPVTPVEADDMARLMLAFARRFDGLEDALKKLEQTGSTELYEDAQDPQSLVLSAQWRGGITRITIKDPAQTTRSELVERYSLAAMRVELETLRTIAERAPGPTWKQRDDGTITWANSAYTTLAIKENGDDALFGWPPPDIFAGTKLPEPSGNGVGEMLVSQRLVLPSKQSDDSYWFDVSAVQLETETLYFASQINELVRAEATLSDFVQTLTKTFAHLPIGLAIFDKKRQLALFNPALIELSGLPTLFLTGRPTLHAFLDALRDHQRIPEPKDYKSWRLKIAQLEAEAADGTYEEVWDLPSGQTYRVSGRPHPDGAVAYLFEDISSEVSLTRSFRSEIEMSHSVLNGVDDAVAVFSHSGQVKVVNAAYRRIWQIEHSQDDSPADINESVRRWQSLCEPSPILTDIPGFVLDLRQRRAWSGEMALKDGTQIRCTVKPLSGGATLVSFRPLEDISVIKPAAVSGKVAIN
ncbi:MAG: PAS-domain containing protein [Pseudomonadota bacterium]